MDTYKLESKSGKYLEVNREEVRVFYALNKHEITHSSVLHQLWRIKVSREYSKGALSNRIGKFVEYDVLRREEEKFSFNKNNQSAYYYRIGPEGYELLAIFGFIDSYELFDLKSRHARYKIPTHLNTSVSKMMNNIVYKDLHTERNLMHRRFLSHELNLYPFSKEENITLPFFEKAWIMEDLTQCVLVIENFSLKYLDYIKTILSVFNKFAKELETWERKFSVIMGRMEDYTVEEGGSKGILKNNVRKIKDSIPHFTTWHQNLNIMVVPFDRLENTIECTFGTLNVRKALQSDFSKRMKNHLEILTNNIDGKGIKNYHSITESQINPFTFIYELYYNSEQQHLIAISSYEGSIKTYQETISNYLRMRNARGREYEINPRLVLIYPDENQQEHDIQPSFLQQLCQKTNFEELDVNPYGFL